MTNKELVAAGHALAKAQGADAPLTEIAKLVSDLATRLDVMTVRADALAVENLSLKNYIDGKCYIESKRTGVYTCAGINKPETPATDAILNEVRSEGIHFAVNRMLAAWDSGFVKDTPAQVYDITGGFLTALEFLPNASPNEFSREFCDDIRSEIANQLRAAKDGE